MLLHGLVIALIVVQSLFFSKPQIDISQAISVSIGELRDTKRLPEKTIAPSPQTAEVAPEKEMPTKKNTIADKGDEKSVSEKKVTAKEATEKKNSTDISLKASKNKQQQALARLKKLSALEKIKQELKTESTSQNQSKRNNRSTSSKSYIVPAGSELAGLDRLQADGYLALVDQSIKQNWALPQWLINKPLKARILVKISANGSLISQQVLSTSGNASYDQYCMAAIEKSAPFSAVPEKLSEKFSVDGIVVGFPE